MRLHRSRERGVALVLVLWLVVVLGAVAAAVVGSTRSETRILQNARARIVARHAAESGIVAGVAVLQERMATAGGSAPMLAPNRLDQELVELKNVSLGNARFSVALTNLSGRLDLNQAQPDALVGLFSQFTASSLARSLVDALLDWRDADDLVRPQGAEQETYLRAGSPYMPRNAPLNRVEELAHLPGIPESVLLAIEPYITVSGDLLIDVNSAPEPVLTAIPEIGAAGARAIVSRRDRIGPFTSVAEVQALLGRRPGGPSDAAPVQRLAVAPSRLLLVSRGWMPGNPLTHEIQAAYAVVGTQLRLQSWRERDL